MAEQLEPMGPETELPNPMIKIFNDTFVDARMISVVSRGHYKLQGDPNPYKYGISFEELQQKVNTVKMAWGLYGRTNTK